MEYALNKAAPAPLLQSQIFIKSLGNIRKLLCQHFWSS